ncbi:carbohydrate kinase family protein, partial [Patescibacteria group bacterium]|nr:carbohydrate kinase family protein [Patescibacteria group bacterium]
MKRVITIGSAVVDVLVRSSSFRVMKSHMVEGGVAMCEVYGGKLGAEEIATEVGGGGTNVALGLKRLGVLARPFSVVGDDDWGEWVRKKLIQEGLEVDGINEMVGNTAVSVILVASDGGRSIITQRGVGAKMSSKDVDWKMLEKADWVQVSSLGGNVNLLEDIVLYAFSKKIKVGLNPGKKELEEKKTLLSLLPKIEFLNLNHLEAVQFFKGRYGEDKQMAKRFLDEGVKLVTITDGTRGAGLAGGETWIKAEAYKTKSVDDTG